MYIILYYIILYIAHPGGLEEVAGTGAGGINTTLHRALNCIVMEGAGRLVGSLTA